MADETRDVSGHEQLSVVIRVVDPDIQANGDQCRKSAMLKEFFLGFIKLDHFDAESLTSEIAKFLSDLNIDIKNCIALCFDG